MIDRTIEPAIYDIENVPMLKAQGSKLSNGMNVYTVNAGTQDLLRIELIFNAGYLAQPAPLIASTVNEMLDEGTAKHNSQQIADAIDYYGAFLETDVNYDYATVAVFTLSKHLSNVLPMIEELIKGAAFPEKELSVNLQNKKQKFIVNTQKVSAIARKKFNQLLFGNEHPYGYFVELADFDKVKKEDLHSFHNSRYVSDDCTIILSGKVEENVIELIDKHFGGNDWKRKEAVKNAPVKRFNETKQKQNIVLKEDALQSAIRMGRVMFSKTHPDYLPMLVLNTVLGGYFGSRLMSNIREDKGYTYGIGSAMVSLKESGYFFISTEVGVEVTAKAITEVHHELKRLREEPVGKDELMLVRNYMLGSFISSVDGPFALADRFKGIMTYGLDYDYYDKYINTIKNTGPEKLMELANKYFKSEEMIELVAGKK